MRTAPAWIVLRCEVAADVDVAAAEVLKAREGELDDRGVRVAFVGPRDRLRDLAHRYGLHTMLGRGYFYPGLAQGSRCDLRCGRGQPEAAR